MLAEDRTDKPLNTKRIRSAEALPGVVAADIEARLKDMVEIRMPDDCDEPILTRPVRDAVREWMIEARMASELSAVGVKPRQTCLLFGPPGCGKTTLAHHFSARLGLPLVVARAENIVGSQLGESGRNIAKFFDALRRHGGNVIGFIDEIDALGTTRTKDNQACAREMNAMVTALLTNIEALEGRFFAATNVQDAIDPAIWRRFGMQITVDLPGFDERFAIMRRYGLPFQLDDALLDELSLLTDGAAPSLLRQMIEGVKRILVLGPKMQRDTSDIVAVFERICAQVAPHPVYLEPPHVAPLMWRDPKSIGRLACHVWPPARVEASR